MHFIAGDLFIFWAAPQNQGTWLLFVLSVQLQVVTIKELKGVREVRSKQMVLNPVANLFKHQVIAIPLHRVLSVMGSVETGNATPDH